MSLIVGQYHCKSCPKMFIKTHILTLLFVISISSASWDSFMFKKTDVTSYNVQEEKTNANSPIVCATHCANKVLCQGMVYDDSNCKLVTDVIIGTGGSQKVYLVNQIRGKVVGIRVKTSESPGTVFENHSKCRILCNLFNFSNFHQFLAY